MFKLVSFLLRTSREIEVSHSMIVLALVAGLLSGVGYTVLVGLVNAALTDRSVSPLLLGFIALGVVVSAARLLSQGLFDLAGTKATFSVRLQLCRRILANPLRKLEEIGPHRLLATLSEDVTEISNALLQVPRLIMNLVIVLACLVYLGWVSWPLLLATLGFMVVGVVTYYVPLLRANQYVWRLRDERDVLFSHLRALVEGAKELKLHQRRRQVFFEADLVPSSASIQRASVVSYAIFVATQVWGNLFFFLTIGFLLFGLGPERVGREVLTSFVLILLYMISPIEVILLSMPLLARAGAAVNKLDQLGIELIATAERQAAGPGFGPRWRSLELVDVSYAYRGESGESFGLGPLNLAFQPGELVFFIGGNGSGKTTLAKVLTGLYPPDRGEIRLDGEALAAERLDDYRQMFSVVFADFHLFKSLIGADGSSVDEAAMGYLARLQLEDKVEVEDGRLSTLDLSQGQRKRLALLNAYLEDRPFYFFDEWAADQDPQYRSVFYLEILPELKARGKTVFVISHDDQYYGVADRLIKLADGRIESELAISPGVPGVPGVPGAPEIAPERPLPAGVHLGASARERGHA
jgi:putative ATP-binding cassette transporter